MIQSYKIYLNQNQVILESEEYWHFKNYIIKDKEQFIAFENEEQVKTLINTITEKYQDHVFYIVAKNLEELKMAFFSQFKLVIAGGGLTYNKAGDLLMILRNGLWDLPKGKIEPGENIMDGSKREVKEETGVKIKDIFQKLGCTYHTYNLHNKALLKETQWFSMRGKSTSELKPQIKEGIEEVRWVKNEEIDALLEKSYPNIRDIVAKSRVLNHAQQSLF